MKTKTVNKLWRGCVSIRDYEWRDAIKKGGIKITHGNDTITVTADELSHLRPQGKFIQSKFKGSYQLVDVPFIPDNNQGVLI